MRLIVALVLLSAACGDSGVAVYDLAPDLIPVGAAGDSCGGNVVNLPCGPGLQCVGVMGVVSGICERPDMGGCRRNGVSCSGAGDCCSGTCMRTVCCVPGNCP